MNNDTLPALVEKARRISPEGLIISGFLDDKVAPKNAALLRAFGAPVIFFERTGNCREFNTVTFDESQAIESAVEYLQKLGHQKIAYIGMFHNYDVENARLEGYKRACLRLGPVYDEKLVQLSSSYAQEHGRAAMQKLLADHPGLTAVITTSDLLAAGALQALNENGLSIPEDISVIGHDDAHAQFFSPPLTSIHYPMNQAVHTALAIAIQQSGQHGSCPTIATQLGLTLTYRESARRI